CLPWGPNYSTSQRRAKIVQTPGLIIILDEDLTYRQVFLDGRELEAKPNPSWMGYSVGRWEGDTLVVESFGFKDRTWLDQRVRPQELLCGPGASSGGGRSGPSSSAERIGVVSLLGKSCPKPSASSQAYGGGIRPLAPREGTLIGASAGK